MRLSELPLAATRHQIDAVILPQLEDVADAESALTKTQTGYVYEIRYKQADTHFMADTLVILDIYKNLKEKMSIDKMRESIEGMSVQVGRLANAVSTIKAPNKE